MRFNELKLPSNRKFGFSLTIILLLIAIYFNFKQYFVITYIFAIIAIILLIITLIKADLLLNLNKLWMKFGLVLGMIVSPIVLGVIFFFLFTPISIIMRLVGRDELSLKLKKQISYWEIRKSSKSITTFKNQF